MGLVHPLSPDIVVVGMGRLLVDSVVSACELEDRWQRPTVGWLRGPRGHQKEREVR